MPQRAMDFGPDIDPATFEQILEMDDDDDRDFSLTLYTEFKQQADQAIVNMQAYLGLSTHDPSRPDDDQLEPNIEETDSDELKLKRLSELGHFLKGSSSTLGLVKVQRGCEKIQHFGSGKDDQGEPSSDSNAVLFSKLKDIVPQVKKDYDGACVRLDKFYGC